MQKFLAPVVVLAVAACATAPIAKPKLATPLATMPAGAPALTGANISRDGFATIDRAPPAAYPADPPPPPATLDTLARRTSVGTEEERQAAWADANGPEDFQREVRRLMELLPERERGNFVELRLVRDETSTRDPQPLLGAEVWFKRDASPTLAKYTRDQRFFAKQGGLTEAEMDTLRQLWFERLKSLGSGWSVSGDPSRGHLDIEVGVTEDQFRRTASAKGWTWGDEVTFRYAKTQPAAFVDPALAKLVRVFAREQTFASMRMSALGGGRIVLDDGCFRLEGQPRSNVMFAYDSQLSRDPEGFLIVTEPRATNGGYRIGEPGNWNAPNAVDENWPDVIALRKACGDGPITNVATPVSARAFSLPYADWVADYAQVNGITYDAAWDRIMACYVREETKGKSGLDLRNSCVTQFNRKGIEGEPPLPE